MKNIFTNVKKEIHNLKNYDKHIFRYLIVIFHVTVKLGFKERLNKEQLVHLKNSEQIGFGEQLCDGQKVPYYHV